jgi:hydroxypyruvate reductase
VPDEAGRDAAARMLAAVQGLTSDDRVLVLVSGGGSALLALPHEGITLADKQQVNRALLKSGAGIGEMNCVRKHLSAIKGGRLAAAAYPARVLTLVISDVPGDDPAVVASGPTVPDPTTCADALAILEKYRIAVPPTVEALLRSGISETPKPDDLRFAHCETRVIATAQGALAAAAAAARAAGIEPLILGDAIEGEAREVAKAMAGMAKSCALHGVPARPPCVLLSGGETTVTVKGQGRGGRNAEFLLALAVALDGAAGIHALAGDTDGIDGTEDNAGAVLTADTLARARAAGIDAKARLADNDGYGFFSALNDLVVTGPTRTNVNDFRAILIEGNSR